MTENAEEAAPVVEAQPEPTSEPTEVEKLKTQLSELQEQSTKDKDVLEKRAKAEQRNVTRKDRENQELRGQIQSINDKMELMLTAQSTKSEDYEETEGKPKVDLVKMMQDKDTARARETLEVQAKEAETLAKSVGKAISAQDEDFRHVFNYFMAGQGRLGLEEAERVADELKAKKDNEPVKSEADDKAKIVELEEKIKKAEMIADGRMTPEGGVATGGVMSDDEHMKQMASGKLSMSEDNIKRSRAIMTKIGDEPLIKK